MRLVVALLLVGCVSCAERCREFVEVAGGFRCPEGARANVPFFIAPVDRPYTALDVLVGRCTVSVAGTMVTVTMERTACSEPLPMGADVSGGCTIPALAPGRYTIASHDVVLPADGTPTLSCPTP